MTVSKTIVLAGAAHIDRTGRLNERSSLHCSNPGRFDETVGGTSLNVASILVSLGSQPQLITQLGEDMAAKQIRDQRLDELRDRLDQAIAAESYEEAAGIRDEIQSLTSSEP